MKNKRINAGTHSILRHKEVLFSLFFCLLSFAFLQSLNTQDTPEQKQYAAHGIYAGVLTPGRNCEVPALRFRLNEQLQLNARTVRPGNRNNLLRKSDPVSAELHAGFSWEFFRQYENISETRCLRSTYQVHSRYTDPVRAGPAV